MAEGAGALGSAPASGYPEPAVADLCVAMLATLPGNDFDVVTALGGPMRTDSPTPVPRQLTLPAAWCTPLPLSMVTFILAGSATDISWYCPQMGAPPCHGGQLHVMEDCFLCVSPGG